MSDRLRVVHLNVLPDSERRPPEVLLEAWFTLVDVASAVARAGADVSVVQAAAQEDLVDRDGVHFHFVRARLPTRAHRALGLWATPLSRSVFGAVRARHPQAVHFHSLAFPRHVRALARTMPKVPVLVQDHGDGVARPLGRDLYRRGLSGIAGVAFTSADQATPFRAAGIIAEDVPAFVVPESSSRFTPGDQRAARDASGLTGEPCLLWIGHLNSNKDPLTILDALSEVASELPGVRLWCVFRNAPLLREVEARVGSDPRLAGRVHLLGARPRETIETLLRAADFFVLGSRREGSGFSVIEALACGTPPLVTDIPSFRQLTRGGSVGALFPVGDASALASAVLKAAAADRAARRRETRRHFDEHLSFEVLGRSLLAAYRSLAGVRT